MAEIERIQKAIEDATNRLGYTPLKVLVAPSVFATLANKNVFPMPGGEAVPIGQHMSEAGEKTAIVCFGRNPSGYIR